MAAAMTDHIQNNPFGRSTDGHRDDWSVVQIGGSVRRGEDEDLITRRESKRLAGGSRSRRRLPESRWLMRAMPRWVT
jgi:hypothetical protein